MLFRSATAYAAIVAALIARDREAGYGQEIDIAATDVMASTFAPGLLRVQYTGQPFLRPSRADMATVPVPVADGHSALTPTRFVELVREFRTIPIRPRVDHH